MDNKARMLKSMFRQKVEKRGLAGTSTVRGVRVGRVWGLGFRAQGFQGSGFRV